MNEAKKSLSAVFMKHLRMRMISGVLVLVPLAITMLILKLVFRALTAFVLPLLRPWLRGMPEHGLLAISLCATIALIYMVGLVTAHIIGRRFIQLGETILLKLPIVKSIYSASKQLVDAFSASGKTGYKEVVLARFPQRETLAVGFLTGTMTDETGTTLYNVFLPTTPNPTSGFLILFKEDDVQFTNISVEEGVKMIASGGMVGPGTYVRKIRPSLLDESAQDPTAH